MSVFPADCGSYAANAGKGNDFEKLPLQESTSDYDYDVESQEPSSSPDGVPQYVRNGNQRYLTRRKCLMHCRSSTPCKHLAIIKCVSCAVTIAHEHSMRTRASQMHFGKKCLSNLILQL